MRIKINDIDFDISAVPGDLRAAVLSDPLVQKGVWRDIWRSEGGKGSFLTPTAGKGEVMLPNGLTFYVAKIGTDGIVANNEGASVRMGKRFLEAVNLGSSLDVLKSLAAILPVARMGVPFKTFQPFDAVANYTIRSHTEFAVVQMKAADRNLLAFLSLPAVVSFRAEIDGITDRAAFDALVEKDPALTKRTTSIILPPGSKPGHQIRLMAAARRIEDQRPLVAEAQAKGENVDPAVRRSMTLISKEWELLTKGNAARAAAAR